MLVLAPLSTLHTVWRDSLDLTAGAQAHAMGTVRTLLLGQQKAKMAAEIAAGPDIIVSNYEKLEKYYAELTAWRPDIVVIDECTAYANAATKRSKLIKKFLKQFDGIRVWGLTGTPGHDPLKVYSMVSVVNPEKLGNIRSMYQWRELTMVKQSPWSYNWVNRPDADQMMQGILQPAIRFDAKDVLDLPAVTKEAQYAEPTADTRSAVKDLQDSMMTLYKGQEITVQQKSTCVIRCLQILCGVVKPAVDSMATAVTGTPRDKLIEELIQSTDRKTVIFSPFVIRCHALTEYLNKHGYKTECVTGETSDEILVMKSGGYPTNTENKGRITSDAVRAIIADVLLWKAAFTQYESVGSDGLCDQYYTECIAYCDLIIDGVNQRGNFDFSNDGKDYPMVYSFNDEPQSEGNKAYDVVFGTQNSEESILELQYSNNYYNSFIPYFYGREEGNDAIIVASDYLSQMSSSITEGLYCSTDIRRASFINVMYESDKNLPITKYTARTHNGVFSKLHSQLTPVYREIEVIDGRPAINSNWIMYRITDILLMKAEALAYRADATSMDLENAFEIVSAVYYRSNRIDEVAAENRLSFPQNAEDMRALVLVERQRELAFEGKRWYDLVRKALCDGETAPMLDLLVEHKYESNHKAIRTKLSNISSLFFPICEREININPNLKQNEAYVTE